MHHRYCHNRCFEQEDSQLHIWSFTRVVLSQLSFNPGQNVIVKALSFKFWYKEEETHQPLSCHLLPNLSKYYVKDRCLRVYADFLYKRPLDKKPHRLFQYLILFIHVTDTASWKSQTNIMLVVSSFDPGSFLAILILAFIRLNSCVRAMFLAANWAQVKIHFQPQCKISLSSRVWRQEAASVYLTKSEKLRLFHQLKSEEKSGVFANKFNEVKMVSNMHF